MSLSLSCFDEGSLFGNIGGFSNEEVPGTGISILWPLGRSLEQYSL